MNMVGIHVGTFVGTPLILCEFLGTKGVVFGGGTYFVRPPMAPKWPTERSQGQYGMSRQHTTP